jgi:cytoskeletal protein CcmA (bactofilin family)
VNQQAGFMSVIGKSIHITGEVRATADLTIEGEVTGPVICEGVSITLTATATVTGDVIGGEITVFGRSSGQLIATGVVDVRAGAIVDGAIIAPRLILHDGARVNGRVDPKRVDAALSVMKFQQKQRDAS